MAHPNDPRELEEARAIAGAKRGIEEAFAYLLNRYNRAVYDYCRRIVRGEDARDLAQETFVKAFLSIGSFDERRPFAPWLFSITHNLVVDYLRKKRVPTVAATVTDGEDDRQFEFPDRTRAPDELLARKEFGRTIENALYELEDKYREVLILRHREGFSYEEIARILGLPVGTVKVRIHRGREQMKQKLAGLV